jgi:hypothetical protein
MPSIHIFNPGHETAVLLESPAYTPPVNVAVMTKDLAYLPLWYAEPEDLIYTGSATDDEFYHHLPQALGPFAANAAQAPVPTRTYQATPWGLSPQIIQFYKRVQKTSGLTLQIPEWRPEWKTLTGRQSSIACHRQIRELLPQYKLPEPPALYDQPEAIEAAIRQQALPVVLKTPYSSSGRGVLWISERELSRAERQWIAGAIRKQGFVSLESGLNKTVDFAMEFYASGDGQIRYEGLSVFDTAEKGAYSGNRLAPQEQLHAEIAEKIGNHQLQQIREAVATVLQKNYGHQYTGYLGVDMLLYTARGETLIHPCVEVNMRFTMGMVALRLFARYIHPEAQGMFRVSYEKEAGTALRHHRQMLTQAPLHIQAGKIRNGYLSLCPVHEDTHYRAYLTVS